MMKYPIDFSTHSLSEFFDSGCINVEQLNEYVRRLIQENNEIKAGAQRVMDENSLLEYKICTAQQELSLRKEYDESLSKVAMERDQYKAELVECSRLIEQMQVSEHQKHLELESLRAKIKELESLKFFMELHENGYFIPIEGQNFEFTKD